MHTKQNKRKALKKWVRILLILILSLGIFIPLVTLYLHSINNKQTEKERLYSYQINQNTDYKVQLFDNNFVEEKEMDSNKIYIADLTKNINLTMNYTYSGTKNIPLTYSYEIVGNLYGENNDSQTETTNTVWEKNYTLLERKTKKVESNSSGFAIAENIDIDYPKYKEEVSKFKNKFGMNLTTKLKITMNIKVEGAYQNERIQRSDKIILNIPVGIQAFSITEDYKKSINKDIYKTNKDSNNIISIKGYITISIVSTLLFIILFKTLFDIKPKSSYTKQLNKMLKNYDQIIVEIENPEKETNDSDNIINVKNFNEMLDLEEELKLPIIFYEDIDKQEAIFTITKDGTIYQYILKDQS